MPDDFITSIEYQKIFFFSPTVPDKIISRESSWLEFKESFNWMAKDKYAKSIVAFANNKGGYLVFGIADNPRKLVGLQNNNFETTDEAKITVYLNSVFSPEIQYEKFVVEVQGKTVGILHVGQCKNKPIVCIKNDGELKEADIYYRYNARSERIKYPDLKLLFDRVREEERKSWMEHFEKISKIGASNAAIFDVAEGKISGTGGVLVIDKKLVAKLKFIKEGSFKEKGKPVLKLVGNVKPVSVSTGSGGAMRITDDPTAPAMRLEEEEIIRKKYPLGYNELTKVLLDRYIDFKRNDKYHKLRKEFAKDEQLRKTRFLDPSNHKSSSKDFFSPKIYKEFDKYYHLKPKS